MTFFQLQQIPHNVPKDKLEQQVKLLSRFQVFSDKTQVVLTYLGGITNHGFKAEAENLFVRVPGSNSNHFVDRQRELNALQKLADVGLYDHVTEAYAEGELKGYKVEPFIAGQTLQFDDFVSHQWEVLPDLKALHDSNVVFENEYDIFEQLSLMCDALAARGETTLPFLSEGKLDSMPIVEVKQYIAKLLASKRALFRTVAPAPCHNDITPINFIKLKYPVNNRQYQLVDWEYAGMNDRMYDVAGIAAMLGMPLSDANELVCRYFNSEDQQRYDEEIKRVMFYMPVIKLYYAIWAALQVSTGNESSSIDELKQGWGPGSLSVFLAQYHAQAYQALIQT